MMQRNGSASGHSNSEAGQRQLALTTATTAQRQSAVPTPGRIPRSTGAPAFIWALWFMLDPFFSLVMQFTDKFSGFVIRGVSIFTI